jgi:hypothetical protein
MKMNLMTKRIAAILIAVGGVCGLQTGAAAAQEPQTQEAQSGGRWGHGMEGTWLVEITLKNCSTDAELAPPFTSLLTFAQGGTLTETTAAPAFFPAVRGPAHGVWSWTGNHQYQASMLALITLNGALVKTQTVTQKISLGSNGQDFASSATIQFASPKGEVIANGCAAAVGIRFE